MAKCNSVEFHSYKTHNIYPNLGVSLSNQKQFRLNKINKVKDYFVAQIKERELMRTRLSKSLIVLSITTSSISIASFATVIGAPVGIASASFSLAFSISIRIVERLLKITRNKKKPL